MNTTRQPFKSPFLSRFTIDTSQFPFSNEEIKELDAKLVSYERSILDPDIGKYLLTKNELFASFAISKAENSALSLNEARELYELISRDPTLALVKKELKQKGKLTVKDYEKLEFLNIVRVFKGYNQNLFSLKELNVDFIKELHFQLTKGLDVFDQYLPGFTCYRAGKLRASDDIVVGTYTPAPHKEILPSIIGLVNWLKTDLTPTNIAIFHGAVYALHPFTNGNKRVCRVLEHLLLRLAGLDGQNLYSPSYYYHRQKQRYYKNLLATAERSNLNYFSAFSLEAIALSIIGVLRTSIELQRVAYIKRAYTTPSVRALLKPLAKRKVLQFKNYYKAVEGKFARQTFVDNLKKVVVDKSVIKTASGKKTYYKLNLKLPEEKTYKQWVGFAVERLRYVPDDYILAI